jgi:hypothetical protein
MIISLYSYLVMPVSVWRSIDRPVFMPKLRSLTWLIHAGSYKTAKSYARFTSTSPVCPRYQQATESVEHALVECQEMYAFWSRLYQALKFPQYSRSNTSSILSLHIAKNQRGQLNVKACSLAIACGLWVIHRARLRRHFSHTLIINTDALLRAEATGEGHLDSKTAHHHGTQYFIAV